MLLEIMFFSFAGMIGVDPAQFAKYLTSKKMMNKIEPEFENNLSSG